MAVVYETERLRLRTWDDADIEPFKARLNTPNVMRWLSGVQTDEQFRAAYDRIQDCEREYGHSLWIVERKSDGEMLGFCGIKRVNCPGTDMTGQFEIAWRFAESAQGQGYAYEAASRALRAAFEDLGAPFVTAQTIVENEPSRKLMGKLGLQRTPEKDFIDPRWVPPFNAIIVYAVTRAEWEARNP